MPLLSNVSLVPWTRTFYTTFTTFTGAASVSQFSISSTIWLICPQLQTHSTDWLYAATAVPAFKLLKLDITLLLQKRTHSHVVHPDRPTDRSKAMKIHSIPPALKDAFRIKWESELAFHIWANLLFWGDGWDTMPTVVDAQQERRFWKALFIELIFARIAPPKMTIQKIHLSKSFIFSCPIPLKWGI